MSEGHAPIAPSSLERIVECPGSVKLATMVPPLPDTDESREGDAAHWVAMMTSYGTELAEGMPTPNGVLIDAEMLEGAAIYVEALEGIPGHAEERVDIRRIHETECWGTPDYWQYAPNTRTLRIVDYKYGHLAVGVYKNWQLMAYASGVMDLLQLNDLDVSLQLVIVQPRSYLSEGPVRKWEIPATTIRPLMNDAFAAAHEAVGDYPNTHTGAHCVFCPARAACPALAKVGSVVLEYSRLAEPMLLSPDSIGTELRLLNAAAARLEARRTGLEVQAEALLRKGERVPYFALESKEGREVWKVPAQEVIDVAALWGVDIVKKLDAITPNQARKKGLDGAVISEYAHRPRGALTLVPDSNSKAERIFSHVK